MKYYQLKSDAYYSHIRMDVINLVPKIKTNKILEIGCGNGATLLWLKENSYCDKIFGIEKYPCIEQSTQNYLDMFIEGDIEQMEPDFGTTLFEVILVLDVLEHLLDPWSVVNKIKRLLTKDGLLIISVPNIRNHKVLSSLLFRNEFEYCIEGGILDITHLRFFTQKSIVNLVKKSNLNIQSLFFSGVENSNSKKFVHNTFGGTFDSFLGVQIILSCKQM